MCLVKKMMGNFYLPLRAETNIYKYLMIISSLNIIFNIIGIYTGYNLGSKDLSFLIFLNHIDLPLYF